MIEIIIHNYTPITIYELNESGERKKSKVMHSYPDRPIILPNVNLDDVNFRMVYDPPLGKAFSKIRE